MFTRQCIPRAVAAVAAILKDQVRRRVAVLQGRVAPLEVFIAEIGRSAAQRVDPRRLIGVSRRYGFLPSKAVAAATDLALS